MDVGDANLGRAAGSSTASKRDRLGAELFSTRALVGSEDCLCLLAELCFLPWRQLLVFSAELCEVRGARLAVGLLNARQLGVTPRAPEAPSRPLWDLSAGPC